MDLYTISCLVFLFIVLTVLGFRQLRSGASEGISSRMKNIFSGRIRDAVSSAKDKTRNEAAGKKVLEFSGRLFTAKKITAVADGELAKADIPLKGEEFLGFSLILVIGGGLFFLIISGNLIIGIVAAILGWYLPRLVLRTAITRRVNKFNSQIGDALVIIANSLRSGFSFLQAMDMVRKEMADPIAKEFGVALQEMNWGSPTEEALTNMSARINSDDFELVVTAVLIQRQVGGNLAEVLDNIANTIRERVRIKGEIKTLTAQGRMSGIIVGLLPFLLTLAIFSMNPEYIGMLFSNKLGLILVSMALMSQIIGLFIIKKIVNIPV
ncbi:MAG: type II secretion system F family protein [Desulfotomaculaceae bacterium]|nr:type II secretion system F family protein [Desulfotomaculaceae bacterium]MDD4766140.1 type II secretion system F family protein [Desulfotomaculaceae bacterium]